MQVPQKLPKLLFITYLIVYTIYTCKLYMNISLKTISLLVLVVTFALVHAQDSNQIPPANHQAQPTSSQATNDIKPTQPHPSSLQSHQNNQNAQTTHQAEASQPNIVTNEGQPTPSPTHEQHVANPSVTAGQHHQPQHVPPTEHHQSGINNEKGELNHEHIRKMLSEMTQQQLKTFEDSLEGEARNYYNQLMAQQQKEEAQEQAQYQQEYKQIEGELTKSERQFAKEDEHFNTQRDKFQVDYITYNEYLFELNEGANEDFRFSLPNAQQVLFNGYTYENRDGTYSITQDVEDQEPITLVVYENNHRIVHQTAFYFKYFGSFMGNQNSSYLIRFINPSTHKLVALNIGVMFDAHHADGKLTANDVADHSRRIEVFRQDISNKYTDVSMRSMMQNSNREGLIKKLDQYYAYSIVEILMVLVLCVLQIEFVKKLLSTTNIV